MIWNNGVFPDQWRNAIVIPIPKPNKNKFNLANYRPISLINTMRKIMEKIVNKRLIWHLETTNFFHRRTMRLPPKSLYNRHPRKTSHRHK